MQEPADLRLVAALANLLDSRFETGKFRYGLDVFIDLIPVGGDTIILILSLIPVFVAVRRRLPATIVTRMATTVFATYIIGLIPVLGSFAYLFAKPNVRNYELLKRYV